MFAGSFAIKLFILCSRAKPQSQLQEKQHHQAPKAAPGTSQRGKNTTKVLEKPSLFALFVKYRRTQQQGSALLLLSSSSGSASSLGAGRSRTSPFPMSLRVPEPPGSQNTANALGWDSHPCTHPQKQQHKDTAGWSSHSQSELTAVLGTGPNPIPAWIIPWQCSPKPPEHPRQDGSQLWALGLSHSQTMPLPFIC